MNCRVIGLCALENDSFFTKNVHTLSIGFRAVDLGLRISLANGIRVSSSQRATFAGRARQSQYSVGRQMSAIIQLPTSSPMRE